MPFCTKCGNATKNGHTNAIGNNNTSSLWNPKTAVIFTAIAFILFSCSGNEIIPAPNENSNGAGDSSSSSIGGSISNFGKYCDYGPFNQWGGGCFEMKDENDCDWEWGQTVDACPNYPPPPSSSSVYVPPVQRSSSSYSSPSVLSSNSTSNVIYGTPVTYGGETYQTVVIGTQTWFARNLNYNAEGSRCYDNSELNCTTYGRLYNWSTAMAFPASCNSQKCSSQIQSPHRGICPSGWHIPSSDDCDKLFRYVDGNKGTESPYESPTAGKYLKAKSGWYNNGNGTDQYGFSALPGGYGYSDGSFDDVGDYGYWWSASEFNSYGAYRRGMHYDGDNAIWRNSNKSYLYPVRCLQD
ncbi:MAG: fibrobacter succinogenes major paralogous domain-containing protein [Candidatus Fibromonas sp.]|jgi:uncharacterized protein (TIGR02145 family)|nr:fibrobacter succinogenes major paralogous domain-containing protein [Candidatus Fibromonas sp.]